MPSFAQLLLMQGGPFCNQAMGSWRKFPCDQSERFNIDNRFALGVFGMKMRRLMIGEVHFDYDAVKPAQLRHRPK